MNPICVRRNLTDGNHKGVSIWFFCPGCQEAHQVYVEHTRPDAPVWGWNGSLEKPTFTPSILVSPNHADRRCHSFVTDGQIRFLGDCYHGLKNNTVPLPEVPDWMK